MVRKGDDKWFDSSAGLALPAMITAEENGINSKNVDTFMASSTNPDIRRLLGVEGDWARSSVWTTNGPIT